MRPVFEYLDYRKYLKDAFEERRERDPRLSYRKLAELLGLDGSNFHKIILGRTHLPARCQPRVLEYLGMESREAEYFLLLTAFARERGAKARMEILERAKLLQDVARKPLEDRELLFYRDWWTSVVRLLLEIQDGRANAADLAAAVSPPILPQQAEASFDLLVELGLVKKSGSGRWKIADLHLTAGGEEKSRAIHAYQRQILELAAQSLPRHGRDERDVSTLTVPVDDQSFAAIRDILRECRRQIQKQAESTPKPRRVMQLAMAFFPVSMKQDTTH
jgi:uncharacterized protein (TIGR02147 family)